MASGRSGNRESAAHPPKSQQDTVLNDPQDFGAKMIRIDRLGEVTVGPQFQSPPAVGVTGPAGHGDNAQCGERWLPTQLLQQGHPVESRHRHIHQQTVRPLGNNLS